MAILMWRIIFVSPNASNGTQKYFVLKVRSPYSIRHLNFRAANHNSQIPEKIINLIEYIWKGISSLKLLNVSSFQLQSHRVDYCTQ